MRLRVWLVASPIVLSGACSLLRDVSEFDDSPLLPDSGKPDVVNDTSPPASDSGIDADATVAVVDAGPHPLVECEVNTAIASGGGTDPNGPDYLRSIAIIESELYVSAGSGVTAVHDGGSLFRVSKTGGTLKPVFKGEDHVPGCIVVDGELYCAIEERVARVDRDSGSRTSIASNPFSVTDLSASDAGLWAAGGAGTLNGFVTFIPKAGPQVTQTVPYAWRVLSNDAHVFVGRIKLDVDAGHYAVGRYSADSWFDDEPPGTACPVARERGLDVMLLDDGGIKFVAVSSPGRHLYALPEESCANEDAAIHEGTWTSLAANGRFVFLRSSGQVKLLWAEDLSVACTVDTNQMSGTARSGMHNAVFDGDDVYFLAPPNISKLTVEVH